MVLNKLVVFTVVGVRRPVDEGRTKEATTAAVDGHVVVKEGSAVPVSDYLRLRGGRGESSLKDEMCCVCLSRMEEGEERRVLPCMHEFHRGCVDRWVSSCRKTCPICRFSMGEDERFQFHTSE